MRTDELIAMLARGVEPVAPGAVRGRYAVALGWGAFGSTLLMALLLGVRPDLAAALRLPMFWVKLAFPAALLAGALLAVMRLSRPGGRLGGVAAALAVPVLGMWILAAVVLLTADPAARAGLVLGSSAIMCPLLITLLSLPMFGGALWAMTRSAPTRLALAGAATGLLAGAGGALIYSLHCVEMAAPFLAIWYLLGVLIPAGIGAVAGPRLLRW